MEQHAFAQTTRSVLPNDVRFDFARNQRAKVAWTGIVRGIRVEKLRRPILSPRRNPRNDSRVYLTIEHRYFDWRETVGRGRRRYVLSSRGEGTFTAIVDMELGGANLPTNHFMNSMVVVYGTPVAMERSNPVVRSYHFRITAKRRMFATGHYGRPTRY